MSQDYKPVNDRTINDVNLANKAAWDSGEFRHGDAESEFSKLHPKREDRSAEGYRHVNTTQPKGENVTHGYERQGGKTVRVKSNMKENEVAGFLKGDAFDVVHTPEGVQQLVRNGQIVSHHDEKEDDAAKYDRSAAQAALNKRVAKEGEMAARIKANREDRNLKTPIVGPSGRVVEIRDEEDVTVRGDERARRQVHLPRKAGRQWRKGEWS